jgi:sugar phosphate isomerase/epimerase
VRDLSAKDFAGTLEKVAALGYRHFEFAGYGGLSGDQTASLLKRLKVTTCGTHEGFANVTSDLDGVIEFNRKIGTPYIVVPSMPGELRKGTAAQIEKFGGELNRIGRKVKDSGMQLCYHNHSFEFEKVGGKTVYEILFSATDKDLVKAEVDIAWVYNANVDPVAFMENWGDRIKLLHMKDMDSDRKLAPVGTGLIDLKGVVAKAKEIGVDWYIVEQDQSRDGKDIMDEITISYRNMVKLLS